MEWKYCIHDTTLLADRSQLRMIGKLAVRGEWHLLVTDNELCALLVLPQISPRARGIVCRLASYLEV